MLTRIELSNLLLLLQKEKSRLILDMLLDAEEKDSYRLFFWFEFEYGWMLSFLGSKSSW